MRRRLAAAVRSDPAAAALVVEVAFAAATLLGVGLTLLSPSVPTLPLADVGLSTAAVSIVALTLSSLVAASWRIARLVTGRGSLGVESVWRALELGLAFFVLGVVALAVRLGRFAATVPDPRGGGVFVGLFLAFVLLGVGLAVVVALRAMWRVVDAEIQSARADS